MKHQTIAVLDFGSQYTQVIARRIRECSVYSKIYHYKTSAKELKKDNVVGIILSGGPESVLSKGSPRPDRKIFELGVPVLGICYGVQLLALMLGGKVEKSRAREYGHGELKIKIKGSLFKGLPNTLRVWNSHGDRLGKLPKGFRAVASTENSGYAGIADEKRKFYGIQFHPEVHHTEGGLNILENFLRKICGCQADWSMASLAEESIAGIREKVGDDRVLLGLSGGVDSSVAAALIHKAVGRQLTCVFVDNGLLRLNERELVVDLYKRHFNMDVRVARAGSKFLKRLKGVSDPERKRKIIGNTFVEVFQDSLKRIGDSKFLAQGTLYPDVIESVSIDGNPAATIKSHHNVGGLPKNMKFELLEPLRQLFKDEVRALGSELGLPKEVVWRQPFPGPGLGVRVLGSITKRKLNVLRQADAVLHEEMMASDLYYKVWQSFCVFIPVRTVGVMGDERTYENVIAVRVVESKDAMTADWVRVPYEVLQRVSNRIINEVSGVNRVVYDISSKPPGTIEWEQASVWNSYKIIMKIKRVIPAVIAVSLILGSHLNGADSDEEIIQQTIERARAYLGDSNKLNSITSIHYKGSLLYSSGDLGTIEMVYQKPMKQRMVAVIGDRKEVSVLNNSEGWTTFERVVDSVPLSMEIFDPIRILIMQASVREAFGFFRKPNVRNGEITYEGKETVKGHECVVLTYHHGDGIAFRRFIDAETGQVRRTLDSKGVEYIEEGEIMVEGVRFPKKMVSTFSTAIGSQTMEFAYTSIEINKNLPESDFIMPLP